MAGSDFPVAREPGDPPTMEDKIAFAFAQLASEYCGFLRQTGDVDLPRWLRDAARILAGLAQTGFALPDVDVEGEDEPTAEPERLPLPAFGKWDLHRLVFHAYEQHQEPVVGSLSGDLTGIDMDLRRGLACPFPTNLT